MLGRYNRKDLYQKSVRIAVLESWQIGELHIPRPNAANVFLYLINSGCEYHLSGMNSSGRP